jgi:hypothetical protein
MYSITVDEIMPCFSFIFLFLLSIGAFSPMTIARLITWIPKTIYPKAFGKENIPEKVLSAIELIDDPEGYQVEFGCQLIFIRILGVIALLMVCGIATTYISFLTN